MIIDPQQVPDTTGSNYPDAFKSVVVGRVRKRLGDAAGLNNFGVNLVRLAPGSSSALRHWHTRQDEFVYILEGEIILSTNSGEQVLKPGMAAGFPAGEADAHHLINRSNSEVVYLEVGDRSPDDEVNYPDNDLMIQTIDNNRISMHKSGELY